MNCPYCDSEKDYSNLGNHWRQSCGYPEPKQEYVECFDGLLMGDGTLKKSHKPDQRGGNQSIEVVSINEKFVNYLYDNYSPFFTEPTIRRTAEDCASNAIDSEVISSPEGSVFRTQYRIVSRTIPYFNKYDSWKSSGSKRWPENIPFTPIRLKYLYCCDGGLSWNKETNSSRAQISSKNEPEQLDRLEEMLYNLDVQCSVYDDRIMLKPTSTNKFLNYIGEPVPGFEYKWENSSLNRYENLYRNVYHREAHTYTI